METTVGKNTHYLHRSKAIASYSAARLLLHEEGMAYPAYVMLKESLRATLAYICETAYDKVYEEKSRLKNLLSTVPAGYLEDNQLDVFMKLLELENEGLSAIMSVDYEELRCIKRNLKRLIGVTFGADCIQ